MRSKKHAFLIFWFGIGMFLLGAFTQYYMTVVKVNKAINELRVKQPHMFIMYPDHNFKASIFIACIKERSKEDISAENTVICLAESAYKR